MGWYTLSLRPPCATDNNKNKSALWPRSSNDRGAQTVIEITPHPGFSSVSNYPPLCVNKHITWSLREENLSCNRPSLLPLMARFDQAPIIFGGLLLEESTKIFSHLESMGQCEHLVTLQASQMIGCSILALSATVSDCLCVVV